MDKWIEVNIFLDDYSKTNEVLLKNIKPLVDEFYSEDFIESWHFFREPFICLRFLASDWDCYDEIIDRFNIKFKDFNYKFVDYNGEEELYGKDAWKTCYKRWEAGANLALVLINNPEKSIKFHVVRDLHLILNQLNFETMDELSFAQEYANIMQNKLDGELTPKG